MTLSMTRGSTAAGTVRTHVLTDRITRASCFVCADATARGDARALDRGRGAGAARVARVCRRPHALPPRPAARGQDARGGPDVPRALGLDDRRRRRAQHDDPQLLRAEHGVRDAAGTREARARLPRGEHGRRQEAVVRVLPLGAREDRDRRGLHLRRPHRARAPYDRRRPRGALVGRDARRRRLRHAVGRVHAGDGDRRGVRRNRPGSGDGGHLSMAHGTARRVEGGLRPRSAFPGSRSGRSGAAPPSPPRATGSARSAAQARARSTASRRSSRRRALPGDQRLGLDGDRRQRELLPGPPRTRRAERAWGDRARLQLRRDGIEQFERVYGPEGDWAQFFRTGRGYVGTELLRDVEIPPATSSSTAGSRARRTTTSPPRTARSTCGAWTKPRSAMTPSSGSGPPRASGDAAGRRSSRSTHARRRLRRPARPLGPRRPAPAAVRRDSRR